MSEPKKVDRECIEHAMYMASATCGAATVNAQRIVNETVLAICGMIERCETPDDLNELLAKLKGSE